MNVCYIIIQNMVFQYYDLGLDGDRILKILAILNDLGGLSAISDYWLNIVKESQELDCYTKISRCSLIPYPTNLIFTEYTLIFKSLLDQTIKVDIFNWGKLMYSGDLVSFKGDNYG